MQVTFLHCAGHGFRRLHRPSGRQHEPDQPHDRRRQEQPQNDVLHDPRARPRVPRALLSGHVAPRLLSGVDRLTVHMYIYVYMVSPVNWNC